MSKQTKIAIIQLLRIGDVLQTLQSIKGLKQGNKNTHLTLIARKKFAKGLEFLIKEEFDEIIYVDLEMIVQGHKNLNSMMGSFKNLTSMLNAKTFDLVINLSFNKSSSYLTTLINSKVTMGLQRNSKNQVVINDKWSQYVYSVVMNGTLNPLNLVDIYRNLIGSSRFTYPIANETQREPTIVIHPFASQVKKMWSTQKWIELIYQLLKDTSAKIQLVGANEDIKKQNEIAQSPLLASYKGRIEAYAGINNIEQTYHLLKKASLFIGHDSMVSHLAGYCATPTITVSLGPVRPHETTPYGNFAINFAPKTSCFPCPINSPCDFYACHSDIGPRVVSEVVKSLQNAGHLSWDEIINAIPSLLLNSTTIYSATYPGTQGQFLQSQETKIHLNELFRTFYYYAWHIYLKGTDPYITVPDLYSDEASTLKTLVEALHNLSETYKFGIKFSNELIDYYKNEKTDTKLLLKIHQRIQDVESLVQKTKESFPIFSPLIDFFHVSMANVKGETGIAVAQNILILHYDASNLTLALIELSEQVLARHGEAKIRVPEINA